MGYSPFSLARNKLQAFLLRCCLVLFISWGGFLFRPPLGIAAEATSTPSLSENSANASNFSITLHSTYTVNAVGKTLVEHQFTITNKSPEFFVSKYGINLSSTHLANLKITSNGQTLTPQQSTENGRTNIEVAFPDQVLGEGKQRDLVISYLDSDVTQMSGKVLEVNIPKLTDHYQYQQYQVTLKVPNIFGNPTRMNPSTFALKEDGDYNVIDYNNLQDQAISAIFGNQQLFDLKLSYHLENPNSQAALSQITLPPDLPTQQVFYQSLTPAPTSIKEDSDGNYIATYELPANSSVDATLLAQIQLLLTATSGEEESPVLPGHTSEMKYWEISDPGIVTAGQSLSTIKNIYDYTVKTLNYTRQSLTQDFPRLGAAKAITAAYQNDATCQEFTDVFIALARQKNIPARRLVGYAYSNNPDLRPVSLDHDVLHSWPEYYDSALQSWIPVDPTWENTTGGVDYFSKFDLNHIVFAINGLSSTMPFPAGSYLANSNDTGKKVVVEFSKEEFPTLNPDLDIQLQAKRLSGIALPGNYELVLTNKTGRAWYIAQLDLQAAAVKLSYDQEALPKKILPFASISLPLMVYNQEGFLSQSDQLHVKVLLNQGQSFAKDFTITGLSHIRIRDPQKILAVGAGLLIVTGLTWGIYLLGRAGANSLRRKSQKSEKEAQKLHQISTSLREDQKDGQSRPRSSLPGPGK